MPSDMEQHYFRALDEIWRLRRALAYEAGVAQAHLGYKTFPKTRRPHVEDQVYRMQAAARGEAASVYGALNGQALRSALLRAGAEETLTRHQWEREAVERG